MVLQHLLELGWLQAARLLQDDLQVCVDDDRGQLGLRTGVVLQRWQQMVV